ncbi:carbohydrate ABC transporter permease [Dactylosporangium siamense]|uniref:Sugar ABC transporter permease n=1 Tax=Dactylosporangium siamense TaxID=685454 RepID=A0A919U703_9ACTN|nr:sugar ABC transporter permease [Dactylosporangium siamense]GIG45024.1 sugar ABC transporter permease [Dactylosporangium siamense]
MTLHHQTGGPARARAPKWLDRLAPYGFIAPFVVSFALFFAIPSIVSIGLSFTRYSGYGPVEWVGLRNYRSLLDSPNFHQSVLNTLFYWLVPLVPMLGGAFLLAMVVRSKLTRWGRIYKPLLFIPQVMAPVAAGLVWRVILSGNGVVNSVFGLDVNWLGDPDAMKWGVVLLLVWRGLGWYFVVFLAGLTSIPNDLLEAAEMDGTTAWQRVRHVVLPLMRPIVLFALVIDTIASLQLFTEPNLLVGGAGSTTGAPPSAAPVMNQIITNISGGQFGLAAAVGWLMFIAIAVFSVVQFRLFREER